MKFLLSIVLVGFALLNCNTKASSKKAEIIDSVQEPISSVEKPVKDDIKVDEVLVDSAKKPSSDPADVKVNQVAKKEANTQIKEKIDQTTSKKNNQVQELVEKASSEIKEVPIPKSANETVQDVKPESPKQNPSTIIEREVDIPEQTIQDVKIEDKKPTPAIGLHDAFDGLLQKFVSNAGQINYEGIKGQSDVLNAYLKTLENTDLSNLTKKEKLAFWINAYNAFTIKKIVDNYPVSSITKLDGGKPWDAKWIKLNGKTLSLNNIENDIIRPTYNEPRIHFAVNCAAKSCPPLWNRAWTAANMETAFEKQATSFINNESFNQLSEESIKISKIFDWYKEDFGDLISYLNKYSKVSISKSAKVQYKEYNWDLNK